MKLVYIAYDIIFSDARSIVSISGDNTWNIIMNNVMVKVGNIINSILRNVMRNSMDNVDYSRSFTDQQLSDAYKILVKSSH